MAVLQPHDRIALARSRALRRSVRARVAAAAAVLAAAWWAHAATAGTLHTGHGAAAEETAALSPPVGSAPSTASTPSVQSARIGEQQPLGEARTAAGSSQGGAAELLRTGGALVVVLGLIGGAWWWIRRAGVAPAQRGGAFEVVARYPMGRGQQVLIARFGPRVLCLQQTRDGLRTLSELSNQDEVTTLMAQARAGGRGFQATGSAAQAQPRPDRTLDLRGRSA